MKAIVVIVLVGLALPGTSIANEPGQWYVCVGRFVNHKRKLSFCEKSQDEAYYKAVSRTDDPWTYPPHCEATHEMCVVE